jgi:translation initiation factor eIF-2B subunit delta
MNGWDAVRRAAADRRSGAAEIAARAADAVAALSGERDVTRAVRHLVRAHPAMAPLWRLGATALAARDHRAAVQRFADALRAESEGIARAAEYAIPRRAVVLTHSSSSAVLSSLLTQRKRVARVICSTSLPGAEGRQLARRLERTGFEVEVVPDAAIARAAADATVAIVGADAVTEDAVVNKVGTKLVALAAQDAGIGFYVLAGTSKLLPARVWHGIDAPLYEETPLALVDAVITERGPLGTAAIRRAVRRIEIPRALTARSAKR